MSVPLPSRVGIGISREREVRLQLQNAIAIGGKATSGNCRNMDVYLRRQNGKWAPTAWGFARKYNQSTHEGTVRLLEESAVRTKLHLEMLILDDPWVEGGFAEYDVSDLTTNRPRV